MDVKSVCEDVTIPGTVVKVDGYLMPAVSNPNNRDTYVNEVILYWKEQKITSNLPALLRRISALTKLFSAKMRRKQFLTY
jgi:hypothetical protein